MKQAAPIRVLHVIPGLSIGGTETMLLRLLGALDRARFDCRVITLLPGGELRDEFRALGVPVADLGMARALPNPWAVARLARLMRDEKPDVVQTWMYHGDLVGGLAARWAGRPPVAWGVRQSRPDAAAIGWRTALVARACALLSRRLPARILCNAAAARAPRRARLRRIAHGGGAERLR